MTEPDDQPPPSPGVEALYADLRRRTGTTAGAAPLRLELTQVAPDVRVVELRTPTLPPAMTTSCVLVGPSQGPGPLLVVDPATPHAPDQALLAALLAAEAAAGRPVAATVLTHHHGDHVGAAALVRAATGAPVWAHAATAARLPGLGIDHELDDGDRLGVAGAEVVFTPGHAPGHVCLWLPAGALVVAGDMVAGQGTILIDPDEGDMTAYLASLRRLAALGPTTLVPAHGPIIGDGVARLDAYVAHRLRREAQVLAAVRAAPGADARALCAIAYADTPVVLWPLAERSLRAHLVRLVADGVVVPAGVGWSA
ncbi:MAG: MBL fold metallo-hydrolase [Kofleriaceae bacterium]|jgi:ribonuclease/clavin/mitogillin|nr:MBL fold metallo-hydrolase [Kofleriaceae bacterium]MBP6841948.1 MBL fold metallo-hydrolase [Kofleriaceae bacterium]MBP9207905.1 MBL fold metallo-hydrolase [Kofleriaceae bacterium]